MSSDGDITTSRLPEAVQEKARDELGERLESRQEDIQKLKDIVDSYPDLYCPKEDDSFLLMFLRARKFDVKRAAKLLRRYYEVRVEYPKFYKQFRPSAAREVYEKGVYVILPTLKETDPQPVLFRPGDWDPSKVSLENMLKSNVMQIELILRTDERTQVNGFVIITDMAGMGWTQAKHMNPFIFKYIMSIVQNAMPSRTKAIHYVNAPHFFVYLYSMTKLFMSEKLKNRVHIHSSPDYLKKHFDLSVLPESLGGTLDTQPVISEWAAKMVESEELFTSLEKYGLEKDLE